MEQLAQLANRALPIDEVNLFIDLQHLEHFQTKILKTLQPSGLSDNDSKVQKREEDWSIQLKRRQESEKLQYQVVDKRTFLSDTYTMSP